MTLWFQFFQNPEALDCYSALPSLVNVELLGCKYKQGMTTLELELSVAELPARRSRKWPVEMNRVAMTLQFSVTESTLRTQAPQGEARMVSCEFDGTRDRFSFRCKGDDIQLDTTCDAAWIKNLAGYIRAESGLEKEYA